MKKLVAAPAVTVAFSIAAPAADFHAEVIEWAIEPSVTGSYRSRGRTSRRQRTNDQSSVIPKRP